MIVLVQEQYKRLYNFTYSPHTLSIIIIPLTFINSLLLSALAYSSEHYLIDSKIFIYKFLYTKNLY